MTGSILDSDRCKHIIKSVFISDLTALRGSSSRGLLVSCRGNQKNSFDPTVVVSMRTRTLQVDVENDRLVLPLLPPSPTHVHIQLPSHLTSELSRWIAWTRFSRGFRTSTSRAKIVDKQACISKLGGSCDVFSAWSNKHGKKVAVKQIREFMSDNETFAKVRRIIHHNGMFDNVLC